MRNAEVLVIGAFDDLGLRHVRFLHDASRRGGVTVLLWTDAAVFAITGAGPKFGVAERRYLVGALRFVNRVIEADDLRQPWGRAKDLPPTAVVCADADAPLQELEAARRTAATLRAPFRLVTNQDLVGFPAFPLPPSDPSRRKVVVTGCYDWLHSGHVRFFEDVSSHGELYVVVGHDANVRLLKGDGHPRFPEEQRRYMTAAIRHVHRSLVSTGSGWMDAEPEIAAVGADIYAVNEDGDKPEKREFCRTNGLEYLVLRRVPAPGLPRRSSTDLRGF
ncbi:MAG TPA: adenylyltransferase/cytidyltransferase family protein [Spirochaetia bacterium]|nr:adenylyltransferase/cytidyltransferase family protein [Spirochaetia bacterium]